MTWTMEELRQKATTEVSEENFNRMYESTKPSDYDVCEFNTPVASFFAEWGKKNNLPIYHLCEDVVVVGKTFMSLYLHEEAR